VFFRHLKRRHADIYKAYEQQRNDGTTDHSQTSMSSFVSSSQPITYTTLHPRQKLLTHSLVAKLIVNCGLPASIVDSPHFRSFVHDLDPKFAVPCRQTVSGSILPELLKTMKGKMVQFLEACSNVALTADIWTDRRAHAFLGVTVHAFRDGAAVSHLLAFQSFHGSHTGQKIAEAMEALIADNGLHEKVRFVVTDNASNMVKAMSVLFDTGDGCDGHADENADPSLWEDIDGDDMEAVFGNLPSRMSCFAHSLQLVVRDGLSCMGVIRSTLGKCSKLANLVHQSALFRSAFEAELGAGKAVPATNDTRWNSTYRQLQAIVDLDRDKLSNVLQQSKHENLVLTTKEYQQLRDLLSIIEPFAEATDLTQGDKTITVSCIVPVILSLTKMVTGMLGKLTTFSTLLRNLLTGLHDRFRHVFEALGIPRPTHLPPVDCARQLQFDNNVLLMAAVLDPTFGFQWLQDHPGSVEEKHDLQQRINGHCFNILGYVNVIHMDYCYWILCLKLLKLKMLTLVMS